MAGDYYIATLGHLLGLSRAYSCGVRWGCVNAFSSPIITKCLTPYEDFPPTSPRAIYWIHWTSQRYHDAGNESLDSTNNAIHIVDNGLFDRHLDSSPVDLHESRIQPDVLLIRTSAEPPNVHPWQPCLILPYKTDEPLVQMCLRHSLRKRISRPMSSF